MQALELLAPAVGVFLADQLAKWLVARHLPRGESLLFARWLEIRYTTKRSEARGGARPRVVPLPPSVCPAPPVVFDGDHPDPLRSAGRVLPPRGGEDGTRRGPGRRRQQPLRSDAARGRH